MKIKNRDMYLSNSYNNNNKVFFSKKVKIDGLNATVSIIKWKNIDKPLNIHYNFKDATIIDNNYTWIQLALEGEKFWFKVMYDEKNELIEAYIDVTRGNNFTNELNPEYDDMFLDIIVPKVGHIYQMDEVELMKAYTEGLISEKEFYESKNIAKCLIEYIDKNHVEFLEFFNNLRMELDYEISLGEVEHA